MYSNGLHWSQHIFRTHKSIYWEAGPHASECEWFEEEIMNLCGQIFHLFANFCCVNEWKWRIWVRDEIILVIVNIQRLRDLMQMMEWQWFEHISCMPTLLLASAAAASHHLAYIIQALWFGGGGWRCWWWWCFLYWWVFNYLFSKPSCVFGLFWLGSDRQVDRKIV